MNSPLFMATAFSLVGLWMVLALLPLLRKPPLSTDFIDCLACKTSNPSEATQCEKCGKPLHVDKDSPK